MGDQNISIEDALRKIDYHKPFLCDKCGGLVEYSGVGEYHCFRCGNKMLDDYGKVRNYLEEKGVAMAMEIARDTGVSKETIEDMIREGALGDVTENAPLERCAGCGKPIFKGRYCSECVLKMATGIKESLVQSRAEKRQEQAPVKKDKKDKSQMYTYSDDR